MNMFSWPLGYQGPFDPLVLIVMCLVTNFVTNIELNSTWPAEDENMGNI